MQVNVDSTSVSRRPIALRSPSVRTPDRAISGGGKKLAPTAALLSARQEGIRAWNSEGIVWLTLALGSAAALVLSVWG